MRDIINPRQTILVSASEKTEVFGKEKEVDNIMAANWHTGLSFEPPMYAICLGKNSFTTELIKKSGNFCVNFMPLSQKDKVFFCGRNSGKLMDKFEKTGLNKVECEKIDCVRVKEDVAHLE